MIDRSQAYSFSAFRNKQDTSLSSNENLDMNSLLRGIWARSLIGLVLIAILSTITFFLISNLLKLNEKSGTIVNISGQQRMLSQRGAFFALQLATQSSAEQRAEAAKKLGDVADLMEKSHSGLISGSVELDLPKNISEQMNTMYFEAPNYLDRQVKQYIESIRNLLIDADAGTVDLDNQNLQYILKVAPTTLLQALNKAVIQYEKEGSDDLQNALKYEKIIYFIVLLTLLLEALLIYRPLVNRVRNTTKDFLKQKHFSDSVIDTSQALIIGMDQAGKIQLFNHYSEELTGWTDKELHGKDFMSAFIPMNEQEKLSKSYKDLFAGEPTSKLETTLTTKTGEDLIIEWSNTRLIDPETQQPSLLLSTGVDITQRKKDNEALQDALVEMATMSSRLHKEVAHAAILQQALLPPAEFTLPGIQALAKLTTSTEVGGDYFDYYQVDERHSVFLVGDVSGHGVAAGTLVSAAKMAVHQLDNLHETDPTAILEHINELLLSASHETMFMTMVCFSHDSRNGVTRMANAGHVFPYIWINSEREWCMIEAEGVPLGKVENPEYEGITFDLEVGDKLFLYTDGILEEESPSGEQFGFDRLEDLLYDTATLPIEAAHAAMFEALEKHCGKTVFNDDVTLMLVGHTERVEVTAPALIAQEKQLSAIQIKAAGLLSSHTSIDKHLSRQYTVVSCKHGELRPLLPSLCQQGIRRVLFENQPLLETIGWENLLQQHAHAKGDDAKQWIPSPSLSKIWPFTHTDEKMTVMDELNDLLSGMKELPDTLQDTVLLAADELIENSLYGAPRDRSNNSLFQKGDKRTVADFEGIRLDLLRDTDMLSVSMTDHWGTFTPATFLNRLYLNLTEQGGMEAGVGGTGMYLMWRVSDYLQIRVLPGIKTQVSLVWSLKQSPDYDADSSFQFLYHNDINEVIQQPKETNGEVTS